MAPPGRGNKRQQLCRAMRVAKKRKMEEEQLLPEALLARVDDESEVGIWDPSTTALLSGVGGGWDSGSEEEEDCEISDAEEEVENMNRSLFEKLLASDERYREGATSVIQQFNGKYQRGAEPSRRTLQRRVANQKELEQAASRSAKITTFFPSTTTSTTIATELTPEEITALERKTAITYLDKKIHSKKQTMNRQNMMRHQAVLAFLRLQEQRKPGESRKEMAFLVARCFGKGVYFSRKVISWEIEWIKEQSIEEGKRGCFSKTRSWFNDEGVQLAVREWLAGKSKVEGMSSSDSSGSNNI